ncbi:3-oxoacyl-[acyl-carrier-protein] reductase FabG [Botrimarina colliarenosi]|uniref:3-oxoacyl-[acyl-carrier-protein] reductase FabG n=1 Tax=Botrimarina colliarenosi TaxID=2528001 RepID=A0A5C6AKB5_9BACT|nr:SDR family NAD(P)-dependent oxidoreductase [Botrimarina colliarenosi]TWT99461.1 3-oxoacyl-[acyl-carrier-protein] reductase FabG [Botrimarina colliarenosi]
MDLIGKRALVTGGTRGIGAAIALDFARGGANVVVNSRAEDATSRETLSQLRALGVQAEAVYADVAKPDENERLVAETAELLGGIDVLVHSAGGPCPGTIETVRPEDWMNAFDVHVHAAYHLIRHALPHLRKNPEGVILLVSSVAGVRGCPGAVAYGVVKGAIVQMTRMLARDLAEDNLRVNCVAPGIIRTRFHEKMTSDQQKHNLANRIPLHREGTSEQVAQVVHLLATNDFMTGEMVVVDGGMSMQVVR